VVVPKPKVFIGSSSEQLETARALKSCLSSYADIKVWDEVDVQLNESIFGNLLHAAEQFDFTLEAYRKHRSGRKRRSG